MKIVLIGAGPRNLVLVERLIAYAKATAGLHDITIADAYPIGGAVWNPNQNPRFMANTISQQLTLFTDDSVKKQVSGLTGPNFYEWAHNDANDYLTTHHFKNEQAFRAEIAILNPNHFASRALFGLYANYYFETLQNHLSDNTQLQFKQQYVTHVQPQADKTFIITYADGSTQTADVVVYTPGYTNVDPTDEEKQFKQHAKTHQLVYLPPMHPSDAPLAKIKGNQNVIIRGLGLSFFDYLAELTIGRGGQFVRSADDTLTYQPSGQEPHLIAGSRSGTLPRSKSYNQKAQAESYQALFFTPEKIQARMVDGHISYDDFYDLFQKEMTYKYYFNLMSDTAITWPFDRADFLTSLQNSQDLNATARAFSIPEEQIIDWDAILNPVAGEHPEYQKFITDMLQADITDARKGNDLAPFAGAFELLKDLRGRLREYLNQDYLTPDEYEKFLKQFNPINRLLNIGPPVLRIEQLQALIKAGIVTIAAPGIKVQTTTEGFVATDSQKHRFESRQLVDARLPAITVAHTADSVMHDLKDNGLLTDVQLNKADGTTFTIDAAYNDRKTLQAIDANGQLVQNLFIHGTPTENWNWFTSFAPRPNVNDKNLRDAEIMAQQIFN